MTAKKKTNKKTSTTKKSSVKKTVKKKVVKKKEVKSKNNILELNSGKKIEIKDFQPKESNLIKVKLHVDGSQVEGIWACLPEEFMSDYKKDVMDSEVFRYATLRNAALNIGPHSWGAIIPVRFTGTERPECNLSWIKGGQGIIFNDKETVKE